MIKYVQFVTPVQVSGLPNNMSASLAHWDESRHGKFVTAVREGAFVVLTAGDDQWDVPMANVVAIRRERVRLPDKVKETAK